MATSFEYKSFVLKIYWIKMSQDSWWDYSVSISYFTLYGHVGADHAGLGRLFCMTKFMCTVSTGMQWGRKQLTSKRTLHIRAILFHCTTGSCDARMGRCRTYELLIPQYPYRIDIPPIKRHLSPQSSPYCCISPRVARFKLSICVPKPTVYGCHKLPMLQSIKKQWLQQNMLPA